jgi:hypothetical protein
MNPELSAYIFFAALLSEHITVLGPILTKLPYRLWSWMCHCSGRRPHTINNRYKSVKLAQKGPGM